MDRDIVDFRNRVMHEYDTVDNVLVYSVTRRDLPELIAEVRALPAELEP